MVRGKEKQHTEKVKITDVVVVVFIGVLTFDEFLPAFALMQRGKNNLR